MEDFIFFTKEACAQQVHPRQGETKFGEKLNCITSFEDLQNSSAQYVIFGIPEDIGIQANFGKPGAANTWQAFLAAFLNIQINAHNHPENCIILGQVNCVAYLQQAQQLIQNNVHPQVELGKIVAQLDQIVTKAVQQIVEAGKTPIIIGGGHNNSYGNIKGTAQALNHPINVINIDAHTDLRNTDYRHSGNGFSFAKQEGYLKRYSMFGIHKNYTPQYIFDQYQDDPDVNIYLMENLIKQNMVQKQHSFIDSLAYTKGKFGLEIDCDAIANFSSSAMTPSGFSINSIRIFIEQAKSRQVHYLHLAEAADCGDGQVGKALSYFVSDFIRQR